MTTLEAENIDLRRKLVEESALRVKAELENAKLRGLVKAAWGCIHTGPSCLDCRMAEGGCMLQTAMREMGIEVK